MGLLPRLHVDGAFVARSALVVARSGLGCETSAGLNRLSFDDYLESTISPEINKL